MIKSIIAFWTNLIAPFWAEKWLDYEVKKYVYGILRIEKKFSVFYDESLNYEEALRRERVWVVTPIIRYDIEYRGGRFFDFSLYWMSPWSLIGFLPALFSIFFQKEKILEVWRKIKEKTPKLEEK